MNHLYLHFIKANKISTHCYKLKNPLNIKCGPNPMKHNYLETCICMYVRTSTKQLVNGLVHSISYPSLLEIEPMFIYVLSPKHDSFHLIYILIHQWWDKYCNGCCTCLVVKIFFLFSSLGGSIL
jgi:hypothetical protein